MHEYHSWLKKVKDARGNLFYTDEASLFSVAMCKLLAQEACVNKINCAVCPAARETLIWARDKMKRDQILYSVESYWSAYSEKSGFGTMTFTEALNTRPNRMIHIEVDDGRYKRQGEQGMVTVSVD